MKRVTNTIRVLAMVMMVCMLLTTVVFAAPTGSAWLNVEESKADRTTTAAIMADVAVTDGLVTITYDSDALTYKGLTVDRTKVAMHAVNADEPGTIKISWVAPLENKKGNNGKGQNKKNPLIQVEFTGSSKEITISGDFYTADGTVISLKALDTSALEELIAFAESLEKKDYTGPSYNAVKKALKNAQKILDDSKATQAEIDEAAQALQDALDALESKEKPKPEPEKPTKPEPEKPTKPEPEKPKPGKAAASDTLTASAETDTLNASGTDTAPTLMERVVDFLFGWLNTNKEGVQK